MKPDHAMPGNKAVIVGRVVGRLMAVGASMLARELDQPLRAGELELEGLAADLTAKRPKTCVHIQYSMPVIPSPYSGHVAGRLSHS
jgi:hypothetical protein